MIHVRHRGLYRALVQVSEGAHVSNYSAPVGIYEARKTKDDDELEESLREDLAEDIRTNTQTLARKGPLFDRALTFLVLALLVELAGRVVQ